MNIYKDVIKALDAVFTPGNLEDHWNRHNYLSKGSESKLPKQMTKTQYAKKAEKLSLQKIDGKRVRAFKYGRNRIGKTNGQWFTSYADGQHSGNITTCFPADLSYWERAKSKYNGVEIFEEK